VAESLRPGGGRPRRRSLAATKRFAYYLVVEPIAVAGVGPAQVDTTHDAATVDAPDDITRVEQTIWSKHVWLWIVDKPTGKVLAKGRCCRGRARSGRTPVGGVRGEKQAGAAIAAPLPSDLSDFSALSDPSDLVVVDVLRDRGVGFRLDPEIVRASDT